MKKFLMAIFNYFVKNWILKLDGDDEPIVNSRGEKVVRDIVQFVEFRKFEGDAVKLSVEVLKEIPRQVEEYYNMKN